MGRSFASRGWWASTSDKDEVAGAGSLEDEIAALTAATQALTQQLAHKSARPAAGAGPGSSRLSKVSSRADSWQEDTPTSGAQRSASGEVRLMDASAGGALS